MKLIKTEAADKGRRKLEKSLDSLKTWDKSSARFFCRRLIPCRNRANPAAVLISTDKRFKKLSETTDTGPRERWHNAVCELGVALSDTVISTAYHDLLAAPHIVSALQKGLEILVDWYGIGAGR
jgi:hypothetical protein